ncbi:pimeloyl-ACP methyl ester carboxylesterase [Paraburkholderia tropica]|uniref:alpha/beta fold hydrolase n=1 Tax=Paraburkholderia tropica TaxID=92647 RepID=UPI001821DDEB|nr:alpha/beta hydrolase [Paraburkholderia tropica]MBB3003989.1 pimeloyl-ACP methyl ester carboxylesterase [Paraburkholderia tropica]MBB6323415.1 pimeloyl-ACP methyl ester carboxylesterase [Paraburkholderia tropica]
MSNVKNVVLVHGAFVDGSSWVKVVRLLQKRGYHVASVQNPLTSLDADVDATRRVIDQQDGDVLLVGHSWGGAVVTQAANDEKVRGIVYISALVPDTGESASDLLHRMHAPMEGLHPDKHGLIWLNDAGAFGNVMANDLPRSDVEFLAAVSQPILASAFEEKIAHAAWHEKPSWYLITEGDQALPTPVQESLARQISAKSTRIQSSHLSLLSHPEAVADIVDHAAHTFK